MRYTAEEVRACKKTIAPLDYYMTKYGVPLSQTEWAVLRVATRRERRAYMITKRRDAQKAVWP